MHTQTTTHVSHFTIHTLYFWFHSLVFLLWYPLRLDGLFSVLIFFLRATITLYGCVCVRSAHAQHFYDYSLDDMFHVLSRTHTHSVNELSFTFSAYFFLLLSTRNRNGLGICLNLCTDTIMNVYLHFMRYKIFHSSKERLSLLIFVCISSDSPFKNECLPTSIYPWLCTQRHLTSGLEWIYWIVHILSDYFCHVALFDSILLVCLFLSSIPFWNQHRNILSKNWWNGNLT